MPITRNHQTAPTCAGRKRKATEAVAPTSKPKKAKMGPSADETYLQQSIEEFGQQYGRCNRRTQRHQTLEMVQKYLGRCRMPRTKDAHSPESPEAARRLLGSNESIRLPVFVRNGANWSMIDRDSDRRPIEQLFDFLHDPSDSEEYADPADTKENLRTWVTVADVKQRFLQRPAGKSPKYPQNFPDLVNPMLDRGIPQFMQNPSCTVLHDIMRKALDREMKDICTCADADSVEMGRCKHRIRLKDFVELQQAWRYWPGTVMLAEAGCVTDPHFDKYSTSTWISCIEGEIGFAWLKDPSIKETTAWLVDPFKPKGRWLFKVLRAGDAVYMPPGTVHLVFRRPGGGQTMGFAGQMLRRADLVDWLRYLKIELDYSVEDTLEDAPYLDIVPGLMEGMLTLIVGACSEGDFGKFGGRARTKEMAELIAEIDELLGQLREQRKKAPEE